MLSHCPNQKPNNFQIIQKDSREIEKGVLSRNDPPFRGDLVKERHESRNKSCVRHVKGRLDSNDQPREGCREGTREGFSSFAHAQTKADAPRKRENLLGGHGKAGCTVTILGSLKCPCDQKINSYFSLDFKTMLTKH